MEENKKNDYGFAFPMAALYCRLSKDDERTGDSVSIETQKMILQQFCAENSIQMFDFYIDDGFSGLNFERPAFQQMLHDAESGLFNHVITKDLSRLGRDYLQTGYYTEVYFPQNHIRYIAVYDGIDTQIDSNEIAPFKNILNDMYAHDISKKIKAAKQQRALKGYFISSQAPFGYQPDPGNHNHLIADPPAADTVRNIFAMAENEMTYDQIVHTLESQKVINPSSYKAIHGDTRFLRYTVCKSEYAWCRETVRDILTNRVYIGDMVNHKYEIENYKSKKQIRIPAEERIIVCGTHEPIILKEQFERVQTILQSRSHGPKQHVSTIFDHILFCAECEKKLTIAMKKRKNSSQILFRCTNHFQQPDQCKHNHAILYNKLYQEVLDQVKDYLLSLPQEKWEQEVWNLPDVKETRKLLETKKKKLQSRLIYGNSELLSTNDLNGMREELKNADQDIEKLHRSVMDRASALRAQISASMELTARNVRQLIERIEIGYLGENPNNEKRVPVHIQFRSLNEPAKNDPLFFPIRRSYPLSLLSLLPVSKQLGTGKEK